MAPPHTPKHTRWTEAVDRGEDGTRYSLGDSTYLLEHKRLHLLASVTRGLLACLTSCRRSREAKGLTAADRVTMLMIKRPSAARRGIRSRKKKARACFT